MSRIPLLLACLAALPGGPGVRGAAPPAPPLASTIFAPAASDRFVDLYRPFCTTTAALSPDGRYLAYSLREDETLSVVVVEIDHPEKAKAKVKVGTDDDATVPLTDMEEKTPIEIRWMKWVTPTRLVIETNWSSSYSRSPRAFGGGAILGVDADGKNPRTLLSPKDVAALRTGTPRVFDFCVDDPDAVLVLAGTPSEYNLYKLNTQTGALHFLTLEAGQYGMTSLIDRQGVPRIGVPNTTLASPPYRYAIERSFGLSRWRNLDEIAGITGGPGFTVSPEDYFGERAVPVGFDENPDILYIASNVGRDTYGIYGLDLKTGRRTGLALEEPEYDLIEPPTLGYPPKGTLVFDRYDRRLTGVRFDGRLGTARWLRPEWQAVQQDLENNFPGSSVELLEWDRAGRRFLVLVAGPADAGAFHVFDRETRKMMEFVNRAPWLAASKPHRTIPFAVDGPGAGRITGTLTFPRAARIMSVPLVVLCPRQPWVRAATEFHTEVAALAEMGFAVLQTNGRGAWGFGVKHREAITAGYERAQTEDIVAAIDVLAKRYRIDPKRVALMGETHGGFVALRALELQPERFRTAVAIHAPMDLAAWLETARWTTRSLEPRLTSSCYGDREHLKEASVLRQAGAVTKPVFLLTFPGLRGGQRTFTYLDTMRFADGLRRNHGTAEILELEEEFMHHLPRARSAALCQIEEFLNTYLYDYAVRLGPLVEVEADVK